jgi:hypothetical protein
MFGHKINLKHLGVIYTPFNDVFGDGSNSRNLYKPKQFLIFIKKHNKGKKIKPFNKNKCLIISI